MAAVAADAVNEHLRAAAGLEHVAVVIGFQHKHVTGSQNALDLRRHVPQVGGNAESSRFGRGAVGQCQMIAEADAAGIVRDHEGADFHRTEVEALGGYGTYEAGLFESLHRMAEAALEDGEVFGGGDKRYVVSPAVVNGGGVDMIAVGVGDEQSVDIGGVKSVLLQGLRHAVLGEAHIDEDAGLFARHEQTVALAAAADDDQTIRHADEDPSAPPRTATMIRCGGGIARGKSTMKGGIAAVIVKRLFGRGLAGHRVFVDTDSGYAILSLRIMAYRMVDWVQYPSIAAALICRKGGFVA